MEDKNNYQDLDNMNFEEEMDAFVEEESAEIFFHDTHKEKVRNKRHASSVHTQRKEKIVKDVYRLGEEMTPHQLKGHYLSKNKVHCSCPMCQSKVKNQGFKHSDKKQMARLNDEVDDD